MLFNSLQFALFLPIVFVLYWFVSNKNSKVQNIILLVASYVFYGWWDWRFLCLLFLLSVSNYFIGIEIENNQEKWRSKIWFVMGLIINLGVLGIFKYFDFFIDSFIDLISLFGYDLPRSTTKIILPVGISFYTFLSLSYIIDIRKKNLNSNRNVIEVLLSLSFFPIILAGPIQRPSSMLPQITKKHEFNYDQAVSGLWQALWGLFTKVVVADNLASLVNDIFDNFSGYSGSILVLGAVFFTIQIYADFSAYSSMAIGIAKLFGFNLMKNFAFPYFSRDLVEFWKRWHISLVTWFRDYVFLPISFTLSSRIKGMRVLYIRTDLFIYAVASSVVWFLTGLWHGANYTFIIWGMIHGFFLIALRWQIKPRKRVFKRLGINNKNIIIKIIEASITLCIVIISWIFFKANNIHEAILYLDRIFSESLLSIPKLIGIQNTNMILAIFFISAFLSVEWKNRHNDFVLERMKFKSILSQISVVCLMITIIFLFTGESLDFIYFKF
jgi:alginate O-acetyltransferase complex protein AlgI